MPNDTVVHVIDDDDAARESLEFLLRSAKFAVRTYPSAVAFLDALATIQSRCIITDVRMPEVSGLELLERLREKAVGMPVILITGHGDVPLAVQAMKRVPWTFSKSRSMMIFCSLACGRRSALRSVTPAEPLNVQNFTIGSLRYRTASARYWKDS
jgi:CheY-like chemotaxis protein